MTMLLGGRVAEQIVFGGVPPERPTTCVGWATSPGR